MAQPSETRIETRRTRDRFTPEQDAVLMRLKRQGYGPADIAQAIDKTNKQVSHRLDYLKFSVSPSQIEPHVGWPIPDPRKVNDWPDFSGENVTVTGSTPRRMQAPADYTIGGVAKYG